MVLFSVLHQCLHVKCSVIGPVHLMVLFDDAHVLAILRFPAADAL